MKKVLFISSTGGHLSEMLQLKPMFKKYDYHIVTEYTDSTKNLKNIYPVLNLDINLKITGTGTINDPYVVSR